MSDRTCSVEGCERSKPRLKRGMCITHYVCFQKYGQSEPPPRTIRPCSVEGCGRKHASGGHCKLHYERLLNTGRLDLAPKPPPKICKVDGCEGTASAKGTARGWCQKHYTSWARHGDPLAASAVVVKICSIDECGKPASGRGWCDKHYTRWARYGDPMFRLRGEVRDGRKICPRCRADTLLDDLAGTYCRPCAALYSAEYAASCPESDWRRTARRRARLHQVTHEDFDRQEIFERDNWVCQICSIPVDRELPYRKPNSPSLDHIVPVARGGAHTRANAQTACLRCNMRKGARVA